MVKPFWQCDREAVDGSEMWVKRREITSVAMLLISHCC
jgi:hypothetical protein